MMFFSIFRTKQLGYFGTASKFRDIEYIIVFKI